MMSPTRQTLLATHPPLLSSAAHTHDSSPTTATNTAVVISSSPSQPLPPRSPSPSTHTAKLKPGPASGPQHVLLTPPLTPYASLGSDAGGGKISGAEEQEVGEEQPAEEEEEEGASRFLLVRNVPRDMPSDELMEAFHALCGGALPPSTSGSGPSSSTLSSSPPPPLPAHRQRASPLRGVYVREQRTAGWVVLAFWDLRVAAAARRTVAGKTMGMCKYAGRGGREKPGEAEWVGKEPMSVEYVSPEGLVELIGETIFVAHTSSTLVLSLAHAGAGAVHAGHLRALLEGFGRVHRFAEVCGAADEEGSGVRIFRAEFSDVRHADDARAALSLPPARGAFGGELRVLADPGTAPGEQAPLLLSAGASAPRDRGWHASGSASVSPPSSISHSISELDADSDDRDRSGEGEGSASAPAATSTFASIGAVPAAEDALAPPRLVFPDGEGNATGGHAGAADGRRSRSEAARARVGKSALAAWPHEGPRPPLGGVVGAGAPAYLDVHQQQHRYEYEYQHDQSAQGGYQQQQAYRHDAWTHHPPTSAPSDPAQQQPFATTPEGDAGRTAAAFALPPPYAPPHYYAPPPHAAYYDGYAAPAGPAPGHYVPAPHFGYELDYHAHPAHRPAQHLAHTQHPHQQQQYWPADPAAAEYAAYPAAHYGVYYPAPHDRFPAAPTLLPLPARDAPYAFPAAPAAYHAYPVPTQAQAGYANGGAQPRAQAHARGRAGGAPSAFSSFASSPSSLSGGGGAHSRSVSGAGAGAGAPAASHAPPERNVLDLQLIADGLDTRTTVMIKNIPNKMTDRDLIEYIGRVCPRRIDFLYLRMDFQNGCNVGYAFVNFIQVEDLLHFARERLGVKWNMFSSEKVLQMSYANYQGKEALVEKFRNSCIMDEREAWRPKVFASAGPRAGAPEAFPPPTHMRRKERSAWNRGALFSAGATAGGGAVGYLYHHQQNGARHHHQQQQQQQANEQAPANGR